MGRVVATQFQVMGEYPKIFCALVLASKPWRVHSFLDYVNLIHFFFGGSWSTVGQMSNSICVANFLQVQDVMVTNVMVAKAS